MKPVPVLRKSDPSFSFRAAFTHSQNGLIVDADLNITTSRPTVNIFNTMGIQSVSCTRDGLSVRFSDQFSILDAYSTWSGTEDLALFVSYGERCPDDGLKIFAVVDLNPTILDELWIIDITAVKLTNEQVLKGYSLSIINRDRVDDYEVSLDLNYDPKSNSATKKNIQMLDETDAKISCVNCYTSGTARLHYDVKGQFFTGFKSYNLTLYGDLTANLDLKLDILTSTDSKHLDLKTIYAQELFSVTVAGLFTFTPSFKLLGGIAHETQKPIKSTAGFKIDYPFNLQATSDSLLKPPQFISLGKPKTTPHLPMISGDLSVEPHLVPRFDFALDVLSQSLNMDLSMDNSAEARLSASNQTTCPLGVDIHFFSQSRIDLGVQSTLLADSRHWTLFDTGKYEFPCNECQCTKRVD